MRTPEQLAGKADFDTVILRKLNDYQAIYAIHTKLYTDVL